MNKTNIMHRVVAFATCLFFSATMCNAAPSSIYTIKIPARFGTVKLRWQPTVIPQKIISSSVSATKTVPLSNETSNTIERLSPVVLVQDTHASLTAQKNIASILESLNKNDGLNAIGLEGACGNVFINDIRSFPDKARLKTYMKTLLKTGAINGPTYAAITADGAQKLFGVEDRELYKENYDAYMNVCKLRSEVYQEWNAVVASFNTLKKSMLPQDIYSVVSARDHYLANRLEFSAYLEVLMNTLFANGSSAESLPLQVRQRYPNIMLFCETIKLCPRRQDQNIVQQEVEAVLRKSSRRIPNIPENYSVIKNHALAEGVDLTLYPHFVNNALFLEKMSRVDNAALISEAERFHYELLNMRVSENTIRELIGFLHDIERTNSVLALEGTYEDVQDYFAKKHENDMTLYKEYFQAKKIASVVVPEKKWCRLIDAVHAFYNAADKRSNEFVENLLPYTDHTVKGSPTALVTGGYHTARIAELLRERNVPYMVVSPTVDPTETALPYANLMRGNVIKPLISYLSNPNMLNLIDSVIMSKEGSIEERFRRFIYRNLAQESLMQNSEKAFAMVEQYLGKLTSDRHAAIFRTLKTVQDKSQRENMLREVIEKLFASNSDVFALEQIRADDSRIGESEIRKIVIPVENIIENLEKLCDESPALRKVLPRVSSILKDIGKKPLSITDVIEQFPDNSGPQSKRIVITGAPSAGKTQFIKECLLKTSLKDDIVWIPEVISVLRKAGIAYESNNDANRLIVILKYLIEREVAQEYPDKIIVCDRGVLDTYAFWKNDGSSTFLAESGSIQKMYDRYAAVILFQTSAMHDNGNVVPASDSIQSVEQRLIHIWQKHPRYSYVEHADWSKKSLYAKHYFEEDFNAIVYKEAEALIDRSLMGLHIIERTFWDDKDRGVTLNEVKRSMNYRRDISYEIGRDINRFLILHRSKLEPLQIVRLEAIYVDLKRVARENALFFLPKRPGIYRLPKSMIRSADVIGEEFLFFMLEAQWPRYSYPYQITYSITPPGHRQEIHGHYKTKELTVPLGDGMFFEVYRIKNGNIQETRQVKVGRFQGTGYAENTPHIIGNSEDVACPNVTVKYDEGIHDRWNLKENPIEDGYTFSSEVIEPILSFSGEATKYSFEKDSLIYNIVTVPAGKQYVVEDGVNGERGLFVVSGNVDVIRADKSKAFTAESGDIIYHRAAEDESVYVRNTGRDEVVLFYVQLVNTPAVFLNETLKKPFNGVIVDPDAALTDKKVPFIRTEALQQIVYMLEKNIPVCLLDQAIGYGEQAELSLFHLSIDEVVRDIRDKVNAIGKDSLLANLFIVGPGSVHNGYSQNSALFQKFDVDFQMKSDALEQSIRFLESHFGISSDSIMVFSDKNEKKTVDISGLQNGLQWFQAFRWVLERASLVSVDPVSQDALSNLWATIAERERVHQKDREGRWIQDTLKRIGFNTTYMPQEEVPYSALIDAYEHAQAAGDASHQGLTEEDVTFFRIYGEIFGDEYFKKGTISGYKNYRYFPELIQPRVEAIAESCGISQGSYVLDVGCALGSYVTAFRAMGVHAYGLDISQYAFQNAWTGTKSWLHIIDKGQDEFAKHCTDQFDVVILKDILEHVPENMLPRFLSTIKQYGKRLLIVVPVADPTGKFVNASDEHDFTHLIRKDAKWWLSQFGTQCHVLNDLTSKIKRDNNINNGTLTVLVDVGGETAGDVQNRYKQYAREDFDAVHSNDVLPTANTVVELMIQRIKKRDLSGIPLMAYVDAMFEKYSEDVCGYYGAKSDESVYAVKSLGRAIKTSLIPVFEKRITKGERLLPFLAARCYAERIYPDEERVFEFIIKYMIYDSTLVSNSSEYSTCFQIVRKLFLEPDSESSVLMEDYDVSLSELRRMYSLLRRSDLFQNLMNNYSPGVVVLRYYQGFIKDEKRVKDILSGKSTYPLVLEFHPSLLCQNRCSMCMNTNKMVYPKKTGAHKLNKEQIKAILDEAKNRGVREVVVSGGLEPLLDPLSLYILDYCKELGIPTCLITNGKALNDMLLYPSVLKADKIRISLLTSDPEKYSNVTGTEAQSHQDVIRNIYALIAYKEKHQFKSSIGLEYMVLPENHEDLVEFLDLAKKMKVTFVDFRTDLIGPKKNETTEWLLALHKQLLIIDGKIRKGEYSDVTVSFSPRLNYLMKYGVAAEMVNKPVRIKSPSCLARNLRVAINPYGEVYGCSQRAQPGLADDTYYLGSVPQNGQLHAFLESTKDVDLSTRECEHVCNNVDRILMNIQHKLIADINQGIDVDDQPFRVESMKPIKIALFGTAMVRAEPIKKEEYFQGKIQKKFMQPPFGVYRLQYFIQKKFAKEIAEGRLQIDVYDPALETVSSEHSLQDLFSRVKTEGYDIIGFSPIRILLGEDLHFMNRIYEETSTASVRPLYIAGGNEASTNSQIVFKTMPWLDYCIHGLGERTLERIIKRMDFLLGNKNYSARENYENLDGLLYMTSDGLKRNECPPTSAAEFVDYSNYVGENIPYKNYWSFNRSIGPMDTQFSGTTIETVRLYTRNYCPYNCPFCSQSSYGKTVYKGVPSALSVEQILTLIKRVYQSVGAKGIYFNDDDMFGGKKIARELLEGIIELKRRGDIPADMRFYGQTRVDEVDENILALVKQAGFMFLSFGAESFSDEILRGPDLRKSFTAEQAITSVHNSLAAQVPITNINLILFPPKIKKEYFIKTVEHTVDLIRESIRQKSRLSVNSFLTIEAYAGAPINTIAEEEGWPRESSTAEYAGKQWEYIVNYLPIDVEMRKLVQGGRLVKEFDKIMMEFTRDRRWPTTTVSRSIGINGLVMFIAAYSLLGVRENESHVSIEEMKDLVWRILETFNPSVEKAATILSNQKANIVYTIQKGETLFRRGGMKVDDMPSEIVALLAKKNKQEVLLSLQDAKPDKVKDALYDALYTTMSLEQAFNKHGIPAFSYPHFRKVLLVAPVGNYDGSPLKTVVPHLGLESINYALIRDHDNRNVDCRVFNPNLAGREAFYKILNEERFDVIGFNFIPVTLANDTPLIDHVALHYPNTILVAGGLNIDRLPHSELFKTIPFDAFVSGPGINTMINIMSKISESPHYLSKKKKLKALEIIPNLYLFDGEKTIATPQQAFVDKIVDEDALRHDIPFDAVDVTHGLNYYAQKMDSHQTILPYDMIGTRRVYVKVSDRCKGNCLFCSAPFEKKIPTDIDVMITSLQKMKDSYDSIHFSDNSLLYDKTLVRTLCEKLIQAGLGDIPKVCKARTDEVTPELVAIMSNAGFKIITFGVESFCDRELASMRKGTTEEINEQALKMTIAAGIKPGLDMMPFSPWSTPESLKHSLTKALEYVRQGAYVSIVPEMHVHVGDDYYTQYNGIDNRIEYEELQFNSTNAIFSNPKRALLSPIMEGIRKDVLIRKRTLEEQTAHKYAASHHGYISFSVSSLLFCKAAFDVLVQRNMMSSDENVRWQQSVDELIKHTCLYEEQRVIIPSGEKPGERNVGAVRSSHNDVQAVFSSDEIRSLISEGALRAFLFNGEDNRMRVRLSNKQITSDVAIIIVKDTQLLEAKSSWGDDLQEYLFNGTKAKNHFVIRVIPREGQTFWQRKQEIEGYLDSEEVSLYAQRNIEYVLDRSIDAVIDDQAEKWGIADSKQITVVLDSTETTIRDVNKIVNNMFVPEIVTVALHMAKTKGAIDPCISQSLILTEKGLYIFNEEIVKSAQQAMMSRQHAVAA